MDNETVNINQMCSPEAEQAVLGSMLIDPISFAAMREIVKASYFHRTDHQNIFKAMEYVVENDLDCDFLTVACRLKDEGLDISMSYLSTLTEHAPVAANALSYAKIVKDKYIRREILKLAITAQEACVDADKTNQDIISGTFESIFALDALGENKSTAKEAGEKLIQVIQNRQGQELIGICTGWAALDKVTMGIRPGEFNTLAADTGVGKTVFSLNMGINIALAGNPVLYITLEMPDTEIMETVVPRLSTPEDPFTYDQMMSTSLKEEDIETVKRLVEKAKGLPLHFAWKVSKIQDILTIIEYHRKRHGIKLAIIDHTQLIDGSNRYEEYVEQTKQLKQYCLNKNVAISAISQLNSENNKRGDKEPYLSDLRGGKNLAQDSNQVWFLYKLGRETKETYFKVEKNRKAAESKVHYFDVKFEKDYRSVELQPRTDRPVKEEDYVAERTKHRKKTKKDQEPEDTEVRPFSY